MLELIECSIEMDDAQHWLSIMRDAEIEKLWKGKQGMEEVDEMKAQIKKLNAQATALKMNLHDLSEDLPTGWEKIMEVAGKAYNAYQSLDAAKRRLAAAGN